MKTKFRDLPHFTVALLTLILGIGAVSAFGNTAKGFCDNDNWSNGDHVSFKELREMTAPAGGTITVDGRQNGGISIRGENRSDVSIRACVQTWGKTDAEAKSIASNIKISTSGTIQAENSSDEKGWSVSYEISVPRSSNVDLTAHNGGLSVKGVDGSINFETMNGGVNLDGVAGTVKGRTTNGGINVRLVGSSWKGTGLDVQTTNGGVNIHVPENFAAHVEAGTTNGGFTSNIVGLQPEKSDDNKYYQRKTRVNTDLNGGGPLVRIMTTNGGVRINTISDKD
ncbi:MAG TPA: DUF4097 family beta strand repeat-containing protein [Pyrinomonadaceae bacterium]|nr:DUF4097 family beta strand repeat-containing protein [Pyrinomonadaceae bacterium]